MCLYMCMYSCIVVYIYIQFTECCRLSVLSFLSNIMFVNATYIHSYYEQHGEFIKASNLMSIIARSDEDTRIELRADYLHKGESQ